MQAGEPIVSLPVDEVVWNRRAWRRIWRHGNFVVGAALAALLVLLAVGAPLFTHFAPDAQNAAQTLQPPSAVHWFGTDQFGQDLFARVLYGGRVTMLASAGSVGLGLTVGTLVGLVSGLLGGRVALVLMRAMDLVLAFPGLLPALAITAILGPSLVNLVIAIGFSSIPTYARVVEAATLQVRAQPYSEAAHALGCTVPRLLRRHVLPNVLPQIIVTATTGLAVAVLWVAALGFLGLGVQPPTPEWGAMLNQGKNYIILAWWVSFFPGLFITLYIIGISLMGDGLRDLLDPHRA